MGPIRRAAPGSEALQHPRHGDLAGYSSHGIAKYPTEPDIAEKVPKSYEIAIPAESFARAVAFAISQTEEVDVNEILFRRTRQVL
jgi:hypothetical protein